jgi:hypothetical protein
LPASTTISYEEVDDDEPEEDDGFGSADPADDPVGYLAAYLIRADQAVRFAFYKGPATKEVIAMARHVADAWAKLVSQLENK